MGPWIESLVKSNHRGYVLGGESKRGSVMVNPIDFQVTFGTPDMRDPSGEKVRMQWFFETPRGRVTVSDYHLNGLNELSILAPNARAALWMRAFLRWLGFEVKS